MSDGKTPEVSLCEVYNNRIRSLEATVNGNGSEGLKTMLTKTQGNVKILMWMAGIQIAGIIGGFLTMVFDKVK